jgi:predicted aspartyl protease
MVSCNLVFNKYRFKTPALVDTGVNGYMLINIKFA